MNSDFNFYLALLKRRLPIMISVVIAFCAIGIFLAVTLPPSYRADARLLVENPQISSEMAVTTVQTSADKQLQIIEQRLMTRANMIDIANKYGVFQDSGEMQPDEIFEAMEDRVDISVMAGDRQRATIMTISFEDGDARIAANIVNELVTLVESESASIRQTEAGETAEFFEGEVARLSEELTRKSAEIVSFKEANKDALPEEQEYRLNRQSQLLERLSLYQRDLASQNEQRNRLLAVGTASGVPTVTLSPDQQRLAELQNDLNGLLSVYSEANPRVKMVRSQISQLQATMDSTGNGTSSVDPMQTMLDLQIADIEGSIAFLTSSVASTEAELAELQLAIEKTPENSIRLEALTRDYDNVQNQYNQAVSSLATAKVGESIEVQGCGERVSVIERAIVPNVPSGPNRKLVAGGGVFAGIGLATLFFVFAELLNRTIRRPVDLTRALGIQPLATIPFIETEAQSGRKRIIGFTLLSAIAVAVPLALWALHTFYLPLDLLADKALGLLGL